MKIQNKVFAVFGYNNTRIYDLFKISDIIRSKFGADLLLVKEGITPQDREVARYCFDHKLETPSIVQPVIEFLRIQDLHLLGCLPFSDKGVIGAAYVSEHLGLVGDTSETSSAMLDKN